MIFFAKNDSVGSVWRGTQGCYRRPVGGSSPQTSDIGLRAAEDQRHFGRPGGLRAGTVGPNHANTSLPGGQAVHG